MPKSFFQSHWQKLLELESHLKKSEYFSKNYHPGLADALMFQLFDQQFHNLSKNKNQYPCLYYWFINVKLFSPQAIRKWGIQSENDGYFRGILEGYLRWVGLEGNRKGIKEKQGNRNIYKQQCKKSRWQNIIPLSLKNLQIDNQLQQPSSNKNLNDTSNLNNHNHNHNSNCPQLNKQNSIMQCPCSHSNPSHYHINIFYNKQNKNRVQNFLKKYTSMPNCSNTSTIVNQTSQQNDINTINPNPIPHPHPHIQQSNNPFLEKSLKQQSHYIQISLIHPHPHPHAYPTCHQQYQYQYQYQYQCKDKDKNKDKIRQKQQLHLYLFKDFVIGYTIQEFKHILDQCQEIQCYEIKRVGDSININMNMNMNNWENRGCNIMAKSNSKSKSMSTRGIRSFRRSSAFVKIQAGK